MAIDPRMKQLEAELDLAKREAAQWVQASRDVASDMSTALGRLQEMDPVVRAAVAFICDEGSFATLEAAAKAYREIESKRS